MQTQRIDEYHKHGCNFYGKLVAINYMDDAQKDKRWGAFNAGVSLDYLADANKLAKDRYPNHAILLSVPELVIRIE